LPLLEEQFDLRPKMIEVAHRSEVEVLGPEVRAESHVVLPDGVPRQHQAHGHGLTIGVEHHVEVNGSSMQPAAEFLQLASDPTPRHRLATLERAAENARVGLAGEADHVAATG